MYTFCTQWDCPSGVRIPTADNEMGFVGFIFHFLSKKARYWVRSRPPPSDQMRRGSENSGAPPLVEACIAIEVLQLQIELGLELSLSYVPTYD